MERIDTKRQIVLSNEERNKLCVHFEDLFIAADNTTGNGQYSGDMIRAKYPKVWELFQLACL